MRFLNKQLTLTIALIFASITSAFGERWSRQLTHNSPTTANDWVPIRNGKSISFGEDLQAAAQGQYQFFAEPQNNRFNLQQQHPGGANPSEINSFASQNFQFFNPQKQRTVQSFGGPLASKPLAEPLIQSPPPFQYMQEIQRGPHVHHYQSQPIPKSLQNFQPTAPPFHQLSGQSRVPSFQNLPPPPQFKPAPAPPQFQPLQREQPAQPQPQSEEQVQLLYVPFDSLYQQQNQPTTGPFSEGNSNRFNILNQPVSASLINDFYSQNEVQEIAAKPVTTRRPITTNRPTIAPFTSSVNPTTPFESISKPKPHQPPLSMFVAIDKFKGKVTEADVLHTLKNSNSIEVMDTITKNAPKVFIGPSGMTAPTGYSKFDLPYLSSIEGTRFERKIEQLPFFVAPLSYRTPPGFSKIPLPAPHVGSVVVNQPPNTIENNEESGFTQDSYFTKQPVGSTVQHSQSNLDPNQKTQKVTLTSGFNYSPSGNVQLIRNEFTFPTLSPTSGTSPALENQSRSVYTTPRSTFAQTASLSTSEPPLTKVAYKHIEEKRNYGHSTHSPTTTRTPSTKTKLDYFPPSSRSTARPQTTTPAYIELEEHKIVNEEYFGIEKEKKPTFSFKFGSEVEKPTQNFNFRPVPEVEKPSQSFNFRPIPNFDFGDSDYVTTKKPRTKATTQAPVVETQKSVTQYTFPSSTANPTASFEYTPTVSAIENTEEYGQVNGGSVGNFFEYRSSPRPTTADFAFNRFNFGSEPSYAPDNAYTPQQYVQDTSSAEKDQPENYANSEENLTTDNPTYNLPSELPSISPHLPGWINSLMDDKWTQNTNITEEATTTTTTTTTRRPINRGSRRPTTTSYRSTATETTAERRPVTSRRRPTTYSSRNSIGTTESSFPSRSTATANRGSKVKYNATSEERSRFRTRNRVPSTIKKEAEDIEYQRDVLNQNYPSVRPVAVETSTEKVVEENPVVQYQPEVAPVQHVLNDYNTPIESVEVIPLGGNSTYTQDTSDYYTPNHRPLYYENTIETTTVTTTSTTQESPLPNNHKYSNNFVGLQEPMQVPQHRPALHRLKANFNFKNRNIDSFYNTNSQDSTTPKPEHEDDEILLTVPTTQATTRTTEATPTDSPIPRRTSFPRRRLVQTTTETPTTSDDTTESFGGRTRGRKENNVVVVKKVRTRTRPTTTTTEAPETTRRTVAVRSRSSYNANRNSPRESTRERGSDKNEEKEIKPRFRIRENTPRFRLETQESQWSSRFNQNSFQPIDEEKSKTLKTAEVVDDDQEIVTASSDTGKETYLFNVTASVVPTKPSEKIADVDEKINMISTTEKDVLGKRIKNEEELGSSFEKFVKDVLEEIEDDAKSETKTEKKPIGIEKKSNARRGVWKKIKVRPADGFETAETQYVGNRLYNSISEIEKTEGEKPSRSEEKPEEKPETTTAKYIDIESTELVSTKETPLEHVFSETTTTEPEVEERKPGMFDEARKALTELFSSEDDSDAVNMEQADDRLEALIDSTTTTQIPSTEDPTTTIVPPTVEASTTIKPEESIVDQQMKTSTSQKVTGEICYRGRCIKTEEK